MTGAIVKKRILFVDDEPLVLQGLKRTLWRMSGEYDMEFAEGGTRALELLAQHAFDVIVTDMRMPGMDGAQLLHIVMERYPHMIRFVLSGHADQDMIARCHGVAHRFLSKPCDPEDLKNLLAHAGRIEGSLADEAVANALNQIENLPSVPALYIALSKALASEQTSAHDLGEIIARDIGMTAKILKLVNSAFFGVRREMSSPTEAVTYLGIETVRSLVLAHGIFGGAELKTRHLTGDQLWAHSLSVATGARSIAQRLDPLGAAQDQAFSGGLLHDVGILILAFNFPEKYDAAIEAAITTNLPICSVEKEIFGVHHADIGGYLMNLWGLPEPVVQSIRYHHEPMHKDSSGGDALYAVHLADAILGPRSKHPVWESLDVDAALAARPRIAAHLPRMPEILGPSLD